MMLASGKFKLDVLDLASKEITKMSSNIHVSDEVSRLYEKLEQKRDRLREQLDEVEREFEAVATTLKLMGLPTPGMRDLDLSNKTQLEALIEIAKANNNILVVKTARRLMTRANLFTNPQNASSILFTAVSRSQRFKPLSKGKYQLIDQSKETKTTPAGATTEAIEISDEDIPF